MTKTIRIFLFLLIGAIFTGCAAPTTTPVSPTKPPSNFTPPELPTLVPIPTLPGNMVDVGGYSLYLYCIGTGSPTVILEAGLEGDHGSWEQVQPEAAKVARVCSYDRAGLGNSDRGPVPRDAKLTTADLHALLTQTDIAPPYILVGHSFGGLLIRRYAFEYPDEVTGMIFVDSLHEDWWQEALALLPADASNDTERLSSFRNYLIRDWRNPLGNREVMEIPVVVEQIRETGDFGDMPITVLTAGIFNVLNPGLPPELEAQLAALFAEEQSRIAALSTNGRQIVIQDSGHNMPRENPQAVVDAIREMITTP
jgi:pimeloyl-ACP methyl ester carboxylesterase